MLVKQLSVFIENRTGRLEEIANVLTKKDVNIISFSLADTNEFGLLRMIVTKPETARDALKEEGYSAMLSDVIAVRMKHKVGKLQEILQILSNGNLNIEYMYVLSTQPETSSMIVKVSDMEKAKQAIAEGKMEVLPPEFVYGLAE